MSGGGPKRISRLHRPPYGKMARPAYMTMRTMPTLVKFLSLAQLRKKAVSNK
jgi:hypothetical protein